MNEWTEIVHSENHYNESTNFSKCSKFHSLIEMDTKCLKRSLITDTLPLHEAEAMNNKCS